MTSWRAIVLLLGAPVMVFAVLYGVLVWPQVEASETARRRLEAIRGDDVRRGQLSRPAAAVHRGGNLADAVKALASSAEERGARTVSADPATSTVSFDADAAQVEAFFRNLPFLPDQIKVHEVALVPAGDTAQMRVTLRIGPRTQASVLPSFR
jgi:hypothetical protein